MPQSLATSLTTDASLGAECSARQITFMCRSRWPHHLPQTPLMVQSAVPIKQRSCAAVAGHLTSLQTPLMVQSAVPIKQCSCAAVAGHLTYHKRLSWCRVQFPSNNVHVPPSQVTSPTTNATHGAECSPHQTTFMCRSRWPPHLPQTLLMVQSAVPIKQRSCASIAGHITYHKHLTDAEFIKQFSCAAVAGQIVYHKRLAGADRIKQSSCATVAGHIVYHKRLKNQLLPMVKDPRIALAAEQVAGDKSGLIHCVKSLTTLH